MLTGTLAQSVSAAESRGQEIGLRRDEVHMWRVALDQDGSWVSGLHALLSADERQRAVRFRFPPDRERFVVARAALRSVLAGYLRTPAWALHFRYGARGKPALRVGHGCAPPRFNLSHSHGTALIAVARHRELGVDIERVSSQLDHEHLAERFFSARELADLRSLPAQQRRAAFFACWTLKEAYLKGRGDGLSRRLDRFDVAFNPGRPAALVTDRDDPAAPGRWSLVSLQVEPGFSTALAVDGPVPRLTFRDWRPEEVGTWA